VGRKLRTRTIWWQIASKPTIKNKYREYVSLIVKYGKQRNEGIKMP
jgi:hypothetical protein